MPFISRRPLTIGAIATAALAVAACGSSSSSTTKTSTTTTTTKTTTSAPATVVGRSTVLTVNPKTATDLKNAGITVAAIAPATAKKTLYTFPTTSGQMVVASVTGTVEDTGGLTFTHDGKSVKLINFVIDTSTKQLTAEVNGAREPIFDLNLASLKHLSAPHGIVVASDIKLDVASQAASTLNTGLGVSTFTANQNFGIVTLTIAVKS